METFLTVNKAAEVKLVKDAWHVTVLILAYLWEPSPTTVNPSKSPKILNVQYYHKNRMATDQILEERTNNLNYQTMDIHFLLTDINQLIMRL